MDNIEKLENIGEGNNPDIQNNDDLFDLIIEQRFKINEIIEWITKQEQN